MRNEPSRYTHLYSDIFQRASERIWNDRRCIRKGMPANSLSNPCQLPNGISVYLTTNYFDRNASEAFRSHACQRMDLQWDTCSVERTPIHYVKDK